jgi:hypothetical protein
MSIQLTNKKIFVGLAIGLCVFGLIATRGKLQTPQSQVRELMAPPRDIQYFTFGHKEIIADLFWVRSIQDFDYCEKKLAEQLCKGNGWLYQMLDVITDLSPYFRMAYSAGSMALTVIVSDILGASKFFDKAVAHFPNDFPILYKAAYHAIYEEKDLKKGAGLVERAAQNGAPNWVHALAGRLYTQSGQIELAEKLAQDLESTGGDSRIIQAIRDRIRERQTEGAAEAQ